MVRWSTVGVCALLVACGRTPTPAVLATTTSVANSGVLDRLLPSYDRNVRVTPVRCLALRLLASGDAAVALTHAPEQERAALREHTEWYYRKLLYNDFLIVGPPEDPAHVRGSADAITTMRRIATSGVTFISRGDSSGTREREQQLWSLAGVTPVPSKLVVAGSGMGQTLLIASTTSAYTLTDRGTLEAFRASLRLNVLFADDPRLLNTYAVIADSRNPAGLRFAKWVAEGDGRPVLEGIVTRQVQGFWIWPSGVPGDSPNALPR